MAHNDNHFKLLWDRIRALLFAHPIILLLAAGAWGLSVFSLSEVTAAGLPRMLLYLFSVMCVAGFVAAVGLVWLADMRPSIKLTWNGIMRHTIIVIITTTVYTFPILILLPLLDAIVPWELAGQRWVLIVGLTPTVVPAITALWSYVLQQRTIVQAVIDGITILKGHWPVALAMGLVYQSTATGAQYVRHYLVGTDHLLLFIFELLWIAIEAALRLGIMVWLFPAAELKKQGVPAHLLGHTSKAKKKS